MRPQPVWSPSIATPAAAPRRAPLRRAPRHRARFGGGPPGAQTVSESIACVCGAVYCVFGLSSHVRDRHNVAARRPTPRSAAPHYVDALESRRRIHSRAAPRPESPGARRFRSALLVRAHRRRSATAHTGPPPEVRCLQVLRVLELLIVVVVVARAPQHARCPPLALHALGSPSPRPTHNRTSHAPSQHNKRACQRGAEA